MKKNRYMIKVIIKNGSIKKIARRNITSSNIGQAYQVAMSMLASIKKEGEQECKITISPIRS